MSFEAQIIEQSKKRKLILDQANAILAKATKEGRSFTTEETAEFDKRHKEGDEIRGMIERMQLQAAEERALADAMPDNRQTGREDIVDPDGKGADRAAEAAAKEERGDFQAYLRGGVAGMDAERRSRVTKRIAALPSEARALAEGAGATGGYLVPQGFEKQLVIATLAIGKFLKKVESWETEMGNQIPWPSANDTGQRADVVGENTQVASTGADPAFGVTQFYAYMYTTQIVLVPFTLANDSAFDLEGYLNKMFATRFSRGLNIDATTGNGTGRLTGITVNATNSGFTTATNATLAFADLENTYGALDPSYVDQASWMFHNSTLTAIKKLVDTNGRPLFSPGGVTSDLSKPVADTILGKEYVINQAMPVIASTAKSIIFGDLSAYKHRSVKGVQMLRLVERYADFMQVGYMGFQRHDGKLIDAGTHPVIYTAQPV